MQTNNLIKGIQVLQTHYENPNGYNSGAEHDVFYMYPTATPLSEVEFDKMISLDWFQEEVSGEEGEHNKSFAKYDKGEGWACYT